MLDNNMSHTWHSIGRMSRNQFFFNQKIRRKSIAKSEIIMEDFQKPRALEGMYGPDFRIYEFDLRQYVKTI